MINFNLVFDHRIANIPCKIDVSYFHSTKPWAGNPADCPSDVDYYGDVEVEYEVLDRKGRVADWLLKKMTEDDKKEILAKIVELCS